MKPIKIQTKNAQIQSEIFVYILAFMIVAFVLIYGYSAAKQFQEKTYKVNLLTFKTDLESMIESYASDYGSVKKLELKSPHGFNKICFIDLTANDSTISSSNICTSGTDDYDPIICDSWENKIPANVFLNDYLPKFIMYIPSMRIKNNNKYFCIDLKSSIILLKLEGLGDSTAVSEWK